MLYLLGLSVASDMDGRVLDEIVAPDALASRPVQFEGARGFWPGGDSVEFIEEEISDQDQEAVRDRLKALGYLG